MPRLLKGEVRVGGLIRLSGAEGRGRFGALVAWEDILQVVLWWTDCVDGEKDPFVASCVM